MSNLINPNQILSEKIISELLTSELLLPANSVQIKKLLTDGEMKEKFWIAAFDNKIKSLTTKPNNETTEPANQ